MAWSPWVSIDARCSHKSAAIYRIALAAKDSHEIIPVARFAGTDREGILSIGSTSDMERRRMEFLCGAHSEGILFNLVRKYCRPFRTQFGSAITVYSFQVAKDQDMAARKERELLKKYVMDFGEPPPLNSAIPERYNYDEWKELSS